MSKNPNVHFSSKDNDWATPQWLFDKLNNNFHFTLDPCASESNAKLPLFYTEQDNGLEKSWASHRVFMNPPYGRGISKWVKKAYESAQKEGTLVVCLLPARTDTIWWQQYCTKGNVKFIKGRLRFGSAKNSAPFPSAIVIFCGLEDAMQGVASSGEQE